MATGILLSAGFSDKKAVKTFTDQAQQILETAEAALRRGEACSDVTILIGEDGGIRMLADSDWPLDSLVNHHGARSAFRVSHARGAVRVEGREGSRRCLLESRGGAETARLLLGA